MRFILSAGRTGTVFLSRALDDATRKVRSVHEPWPARWELMLGNFRNRSGLGTRMLEMTFCASRRRRLQRLHPGSTLIEVNPLLCPLADVVVRNVRPLHVVHIVREPASWARSILNFKASGWRRDVIEYVPFSRPYPPARPRGWREMDRFERELWRWVYCNEEIASLEAEAELYVCLRYEDLFSVDAEIRAATYSRLFDGLGLAPSQRFPLPDMSRRLNASHDQEELVGPYMQAVQRVCGGARKRWGYGT